MSGHTINAFGLFGGSLRIDFGNWVLRSWNLFVGFPMDEIFSPLEVKGLQQDSSLLLFFLSLKMSTSYLPSSQPKMDEKHPKG
jgi:hypothetical protein